MRDDDSAGNLLSTYLLQGWVMTDELCKVSGCSYPLMRSKDGSISFCTKHDELPNAPNATAKKPEQSRLRELASVPVSTDEFQIKRERREQSSKASQLIGQKMLQRWALLNEQCPNESCYAVPLIRNPDTKQMFCVICENYILTEEEKKAALANKLKSEPVKQVPSSTAQQQPTTQEPASESSSSSSEPTLESKTVHSPMPIREESKRQKVGKKSRKHKSHASSSSSSDHFESDIVISTLYRKMELLTEQVEECDDPVQLTDLFKAIKSCAGAIKSCKEASRP